jgi:hypothetical protein
MRRARYKDDQGGVLSHGANAIATFTLGAVEFRVGRCDDLFLAGIAMVGGNTDTDREDFTGEVFLADKAKVLDFFT